MNDPPAETPQLRLRERAVLQKFDGDDQTQPPVEVLLIEDGRITGHWTGQEVANAPTEPRQSEDAVTEITTVPTAYSVACRRCGSPVSFDEVPVDGIVRCECGAATIVAETEED